MHTARFLLTLSALALVSASIVPLSHTRRRRQLEDEDKLQPLEGDVSEGEELSRDKRKFEDVTKAKFGIKNAILGFVFGTGVTSQSPRSQSRSTSRLSGASNIQKSSISTTTGESRLRLPRQVPTTKDGIPIFDRNKVSLDFPGTLFGPSVSLLIRTTKIIGDVVQNSAVRYQSFLRLFRPLFRGPFEIKGLDPPTTTTTTTTPASAERRTDASTAAERRVDSSTSPSINAVDSSSFVSANATASRR